MWLKVLFLAFVSLFACVNTERIEPGQRLGETISICEFFANASCFPGRLDADSDGVVDFESECWPNGKFKLQIQYQMDGSKKESEYSFYESNGNLYSGKTRNSHVKIAA